MGHVGTFMMAFNLALEFVGMKYRTMFGILIETPFALGGLIVGIVSYAGVRDWRTLTLGGSQTHYDLQTWGTVFSAMLFYLVMFLSSNFIDLFIKFNYLIMFCFTFTIYCP